MGDIHYERPRIAAIIINNPGAFDLSISIMLCGIETGSFEI